MTKRVEKLVQIEKGKVIPPFYLAEALKRKRLSGRSSIWPFGQMEVGDSFLVPPSRDVKNIREAAGVYGRRHGKIFIVTFDEKTILRCWRIE